MVTGPYQYLLKVIFLYKQALSELGMMSFIAWNTRDFTLRYRALEIFETLIDSFFAFSQPTLLLIKYYDNIKRSKVLDGYLMKFESYRKWKEAKERGVPLPSGLSVLDMLRRHLANWARQFYEENYWNLLTASPALAVVEAIRGFFEQKKPKEDRPIDVMKQLLEWFPPDSIAIECVEAPKYLANVFNPLIDVCYAIWASCVHAYDAYRRALKRELYEALIPPFFLNQRVRAYTDTGFYMEGKLDKEGSIAVEVPAEYTPCTLTLDTYGLKVDVELPAFKCRFKLYNATKDCWIEEDEPNFKLVEAEGWDGCYQIEDTKPYEESDKDHDDCIVYFRRVDDWLRVRVSHVEHNDSLQLYWGDNKVCDVPPRSGEGEEVIGEYELHLYTCEVREVA